MFKFSIAFAWGTTLNQETFQYRSDHSTFTLTIELNRRTWTLSRQYGRLYCECA